MKKLVDIARMLSFPLFCIGIFLGILSVALFFGQNDAGETLSGIFFAIVLAAPRLLLTKYYNSLDQAEKVQFEAQARLHGNIKHSYFAHSTGIAITDNKKIVLCDGKLIKSYTYDQVREWKKTIHTDKAENYIAAQGSGAASLGIAFRETQLAKSKSGFFIWVKDVEHPEWQVKTQDEKLQTKWFEILNQEIND